MFCRDVGSSFAAACDTNACNSVGLCYRHGGHPYMKEI
uniref:Uncharacterized protein n=1 Tax=Musa acuminata subsp. malaccensis TaxID=214687 RepID=A0A804K4L8_MUSAM